jgi:hypothetical protein
MTTKIDGFKGESERNQLIATDVANEVVEKLKLAIEQVEAKTQP